jgi:hypothetical protein
MRKPTTIELLLTGCLVVVSAISAFLHNQNNKIQAQNADIQTRNLELQAQVAEFEARAVSFESEYEDGALVLRSVGDRFIMPSDMRVEPIFDRPDFEGRPVTLAANIGTYGEEAGSLRFRNILDSICRFQGNRDLCAASPIDQIVIYFEVNGMPEINYVHVPRS